VAAGAEEEEDDGDDDDDDELAPATAADPSSLTESGDDPPGQGPGFTSSPLTGSRRSGASWEASSAAAAVVMTLNEQDRTWTESLGKCDVVQ